MNILKDLLSNFCLVSVACAWIVAQIIKIFTGVFQEEKFSLLRFVCGTGGMPSSHTSAACALCTACAIKDGLGSVTVAITGVLAMIVMIDAAGVRNETGKQSKALNMILGEMFSTDPQHADLHFKELIGHSPLQVFFGMVTGIVTASLLYLIPVFSGAV